MKLENNQIIYEVRKCWDCEGTGKSKTFELCPNWSKRPFKKCDICGKTNKDFQHNTIKENIITCWKCEGTGEFIEDAFYNLNEASNIVDYLKNLPMTILTDNKKNDDTDLDNKIIMACYGMGGFQTGYMDYEDHRNDGYTKTLNIFNKQMEDIYNHQFLNFLAKGSKSELNVKSLPIGWNVKNYYGGINIYPMFNGGIK